MTFQDDRAGQRRRKPDREPPDGSPTGGEQPRAGRRRRGSAGEVGDALRSVYQRAVDEEIPPEMLDLLGKLG